MASSSSSPWTHQMKFDVFLSFRGEDTRNNFTSHLHAALCRAKLQAFIDEELNRGDEISPSLLNAIQGSKVSVVVFSKGYASSRWCLEELVKLLECRKTLGQIVIPVFYHVNPSDVRNQTGFFENAFAEHEKRFKNPEKVKKWRDALTEAANLSGFDSNVIRRESVLVEKTVKHILKMLNQISPRNKKEYLVGLEPVIKEIESLLCIGSEGFCVVGIWGMGGTGKTTLARVVFDEIWSQFEDCYFVQNIRKESKSPNGLTHLQQELISAVLKDQHYNIGSNFTKQRLGRKNVLIVLDDVTSIEQIEFLIGDLDCLGVGSRIIITTRDKQVLRNCGVNDDKIYQVKKLVHHEALQLFSWYAFRQNHPIVGFQTLSKMIVKYAKGVPLALKVLGSLLLGKTKPIWESAINKLQSIPNKVVQEALKVSFDGLDKSQRNIFLDIACFLKGESLDFGKNFLNVSGFFAEFGISVLIDKCLITISDNKIMMHNLVQEMGWQIVREESFTDCGERSRLWYHVDIFHVLKKNMGTKAIEGICLDMSKPIDHIYLPPHTFAKMDNLRFLKVYNSQYEETNVNKVHVIHGLESVFTELRYLCWHGCPLKSLQSNFHPENLVALDMPHSNIEQLWNDVQNLFNLRSINLSYSKHLLKIPDLSQATNLERLILEGCASLFEISSSVECLDKLVILNLRDCKNLYNLPTSIQSKSLRKVILSRCSSLKVCPEISCNIEELFLDETAIEELSPSIENMSKLVVLNLKNCSCLKSFPRNICKLKSLEYLNISGCSGLDRLPERLANTEVSSSIRFLTNLDGSFSKRCRHQKLMDLLLPTLSSLRFLIELNLTDCGIIEVPSSFSEFSLLESLLLGRNNFESLPKSIRYLSKLNYLELGYCERIQSLPELPCHLQYIDAHNCKSLEASSGLSILSPTILRNARVNFINCFKLRQNSIKDTVKEALLNIQRLEDYKEFYPRPSACVCFPGTEIPDWFAFQSIGSFITLKLQADWFNPNFVSFAMCAIVEFRNYHDKGQGLVIGCDCKLRSKDDMAVIYHGTLRGCYYDTGLEDIKSSHVFLGYDFNLCSYDACKYSEYHNNNEITIQFCVEDLNARHIDCCKVKKCGVHLLYYRENSNAAEVTAKEVEEREEPHSKTRKFSNSFEVESCSSVGRIFRTYNDLVSTTCEASKIYQDRHYGESPKEQDHKCNLH